MGQLIVSEMVSLDGVMQAPGGPEEDREGGFKHGGWQAPLLDEESLSLITGDIGRMDALLLGRKTYDIFAAYWPRATTNKEIADKLNNAPKFVATSSRPYCATTWSTGSTYGSTRYFSAPARDSSVKGPCPRVCALLALRRSPEARFTWRTSAPGSPSTATCPSKAEGDRSLVEYSENRIGQSSPCKLVSLEPEIEKSSSASRD